MEALISWLVSLVSGGVGGNLIGTLLKDRNPGTQMNSILGAIGGALGGQLLPMVMEGLGSGGALQNVGTSGVGGIVLTLIVALLKKK